MLKKFFFLISLCLTMQQGSSQNQEPSQTQPFYINVFISPDKTIYVETEKTAFEDVENKTSDILRNRPFKIDQRVVYRIFADGSLKHGFIMDVNQEMLSGNEENVQTVKYLLDSVKLNIDGQNWFESIDLKELEGEN